MLVRMDDATRHAVLQVVMLVIMAAVLIPVSLRLLHIGRQALARSRVAATGVLGVGTVVEVTLVDEGSGDGRFKLGGLVPVTVLTEGRRSQGMRPRYRVLLRHSPPGHDEVVADTEQELGPRQLDVLVPDARVPIRFDPAQPECVALDPAGLRALAQQGD